MGLDSYSIQYKFILPNSVKHSSYEYQKLFRALYGYTQNVSKSNGKTYSYHRRGVLSKSPYLRPGKNAVIIPASIFPDLVNFFKSGKNPCHYWRSKGDWKAVYYVNEKKVPEKDAVPALEQMLERYYLTMDGGDKRKLSSEMTFLADKARKGEKVNDYSKKVVLEEASNLINNDWFKKSFVHSEKLTSFKKDYIDLRNHQ
ncbi:MAG: hypothetical protein ABH821_02185 [archaeon]